MNHPNINKPHGCPLCGKSNARFFYSELGANLHRCSCCGLVFVYPLPGDKEYAKNLELSYVCLASRKTGRRLLRKNSAQKRKLRGIWEKSRISTFRDDLKVIRRYMKNPLLSGKPRLLDVGCGEGHFLLEAQKQGFDCQGIEPSKNHSPGKDLGLNVFNGFLNDFKPSRKFDVITLLDVLEHTKDPLQEVKTIRRLISENGVLMVRVPNLKWLILKGKAFKLMNALAGVDILRLNPQGIYSPHAHLYNFSEGNIKKLLHLAGFRALKMEIINASKTDSKIKNLFYYVYYAGARLTRILSGINLAISLNMIAVPENQDGRNNTNLAVNNKNRLGS